MLPHENLSPWYEKVVWLYVCRTWRGDGPDLEAARIHDRFGVTSWPHLFLIHPEDDRLLQRAGRSTDALERAFASAASNVRRLPEEGAQSVLDGLQGSRARVLALEALDLQAATDQVRETLAFLEDPDVLVRHRALLVLTGFEVSELADHAESLLLEGNDAIRFEFLDWIQRCLVPDLTPLLARVFSEAGGALPSGNPNVLRGRAAACLEACGDERAIDALAPVARDANALNSTTRAVVDALGAIGARGDEAVETRVVGVLLEAYPAEAERAANGSSTVRGRYALRLVESVTKALGHVLGVRNAPEAPEGWSGEERTAYLASVTAWVRGATDR